MDTYATEIKSIDELLGEVANDFFHQLEKGNRPDVEEYAKRHPEIAEQIRLTFPALELVGGAISASGQALSIRGHTALGSVAFDNALRQLGDFQLTRELGRGGMGVVYEAHQISMGRRVALKVLPFAALADEIPLRRFRNEVRAVATLEHPNIVSVYSIGEERGVHYYAMQLIRGPSLAELIRQLAAQKDNHQSLDGDSISRLISRSESIAESIGSTDAATKDSQSNWNRETVPVCESAATEPALQAAVSTFAAAGDSHDFYRNAAKVGIQAASALAHAHQNGIQHRDIKPANLLLDATGTVYLTDFGLARIEADAGVTMTGQLIGTLRYMSPEQASTKRAAIDHRSDIYSLGVTLYELIALKPAFGSSSRQEILAQIASAQPTRLRRLCPSIPVELETIIAKAIEKNPADRYENAEDFAEDLRLFLEMKPIKARPASPPLRLWKWGKRHRATLAPVLATLLFGIAVAAILLWMERNETLAALASRTKALSDRSQALAEAKQQADLADRLSRHSVALLYSADIKLAADAIANRDVRRATELLERHDSAGDKEDRRGFEWHYLNKQLSSPMAAEMHQGDWVNDLAISPDGRWLATPAAQGTVQIYDTQTWQRQSTLPTQTEEVNGLAWSPDGQKIAAACADGSLVVSRFPLVANGIITIPSRHGQAYDVVFGPDSQRLYSCGEDHLVRSWDLESNTMEREFHGHTRTVERIDLTSDGRWLATASSDSSFALWDTENGKQKQQWGFPSGRVVCIAFSPDGKRLAAGTTHGNLFVADPITGICGCETQLVDGIEALAFMDHGNLIAIADRGGVIHLHKLMNSKVSDNDETDERYVAKPIQRWMAHEIQAAALVATADGKGLVSGGRDGAVRVWSIDRESTHWSLAFDPFRTDVTVGGNNRLYTAGHSLSVWDLESRRLIDSFAPSDPPWRLVDISADGKHLAAVRPGQLAVFDGRGQRLLESWQIDDRLTPHKLAISRSGRWLALADINDHSKVFIYQRGRLVPHQIFAAPQCECLKFSPDEQRLVAGSGNLLRVFDLQSGRELQPIAGHSTTLSDLAFDPLGELLATVSHDRTLKVWKTETGELQTSIVAHADAIRSVTWSPDGKTIATAASYGDVRLWHATTSQPLNSLRRVAGSLDTIAFDAKGTRLVTASQHLGQTSVYDAHWGLSLDPDDYTAKHSHNHRLAHFQGLGDLPGGTFNSLVDGISADGQFAVGHSFNADGFEAFIWTRPSGMRPVQKSPLKSNSQAMCISDDGAVLGGAGSDSAGGDKGWKARIWARDAGWNAIGPAGSIVDDLSPDGKVAVGRFWSQDHWRALRWEDGVTTDLVASTGGHQDAIAIALASQSDLILGCVFNKPAHKSSELPLARPEVISGARPVIWTGDGQVQLLPGFDDQYNWWPQDISADGQVIVGVRWLVGEPITHATENGGAKAFRWQAGKVTFLGNLPGCTSSVATKISGDGRTIAGISYAPIPLRTCAIAFIWDAEKGIRSLSSVLAQAGANPGSWSLESPQGLSHDGRSVVGNGKNPLGQQEAWFARLPSDK